MAHGAFSSGSGPTTDIELWRDIAASKKALAPPAARGLARVPRRRRMRTAPLLQPTDCPKSEVSPNESGFVKNKITKNISIVVQRQSSHHAGSIH